MGIWHTAPFLRILLFFLPGILLGEMLPQWDHFFEILFPVAILLMITTLLLRSRNYISIAWLYAFLGTFSLGYLCVAEESTPDLPEGYVRVEGEVVDYPGSTKTGRKFIAEGVIFYAKGEIENLEPGDHVKIDAMLHEPGFPINPGGFDYGEYLRSKDVYAAAFIDPEDVEVIKSDCRSVTCYAKRVRHHLEGVIDRYVDVAADRALVKALALGDRAELSSDHRDSFAKAGAMHVLAVSGLHVGIVWMIVGRLLGMFNKIKRPPWWKVIVVVVVIWTYAMLTGLSASVTRAATMFSFIVIGMGINRKQSIYNSIAASAFFLLLIDHQLLYDVGFQLSYCAVFGIVTIYPRLYSKFYFRRTIPDKLWALVCVSIAAQIATLPLVLFYFGRFPTWFLLTNLVAIPVAFVVLTSSIALLVVDGIGFGGQVVGAILNLSTRTLNTSVELISELPHSTMGNLWIDRVDLLLMSIALIGLVRWLLYKRKIWIWYLIATSIGLVINDIHWSHKRSGQHLIVVPYSRTSIFSVIHGREVMHFIKGDDHLDEYYREGLFKAYGVRSQHIYRLSDTADVLVEVGDYRLWMIEETSTERKEMTDQDIMIEPRKQPRVIGLQSNP